MGLRPTKPVVTRAVAQERLEEEYGLTAEHVEAFFWVLARKHVTSRNPSQPTTPESADSQVSSSENAPVDLVRPEHDGDKGSPPMPKRRSRHSRAMANSSLLVLDGSNAATAHARSLSAGSALVRGGAANASTGNMGRATQGAQTGDSGNPSLAAAAAANMGGLAGTRNHGMSPRQSWRLRLDRVSPEVLRDELTATEPFFQLGRVASDRLFEVLGSDGEGLTLDQFYCALYLFTCAREEETYRLLFNMFDLNGSNFIRKERFRVMVSEVAKGHLSDLPENFDEEFAALSKVIGDVGMTLYDQNKDGKLSFDEWCQYAREDDAIRICLDPAPRAAALGPLLARIMACLISFVSSRLV
ncbi:Hippocalcin-like protein 1 [Hondaea fermentalgiana]|uniref:Hippocalcin-like protein 1 n=1 Tax=Hondaea fermentalgiana TaxID=2315210 RepID=A0A2R5G7T4_9STRA|nr:Hippocalcin-like protein 1 [Hondaea fermentalgiana]|eukprot:GBG24543.1 Hippocalcin-like protein 1 [Hondaea fermentalgiana]